MTARVIPSYNRTMNVIDVVLAAEVDKNRTDFWPRSWFYVSMNDGGNFLPSIEAIGNYRSVYFRLKCVIQGLLGERTTLCITDLSYLTLLVDRDISLG
jgi:hypothetical protein